MRVNCISSVYYLFIYLFIFFCNEKQILPNKISQYFRLFDDDDLVFYAPFHIETMEGWWKALCNEELNSSSSGIQTWDLIILSREC